MLRRHGNPYRASAVDGDGRVGIDYGVYGVPETFVIDREGLIRLRHPGPVTAAIWQSELLPLVRSLQ
jgi:cytochrome c biogenesis protein CcmG/thiol:disulfide interchange protein DsbE